MSDLTPYDTGLVAEPIIWPNPDNNPDRYGRVDFEDDGGATICTVRVIWKDGGYVAVIDNHYSDEETLVPLPT